MAEFKLCDIPGLKQQHLPGAHLPSEDGAAPWKLMAHQGYACAHHRIKSRFEMPADGMEMGVQNEVGEQRHSGARAAEIFHSH